MLNAFDLALTMMSHYYGFLDEANPVARHFLNGGTAPIVLFKASMVMIGSAPLIHFRRTRLVEMASFVILITYALLAVRWTVCFELYAASANCPSLRYLAY